jgi:hypothetical protein
MSPGRPVDDNPDRLYTITDGRSGTLRGGLDLVTLIVAENDPAPGMAPEKAGILRLCRRPMSVAEVSSHLQLPVGIVRILLEDLLDKGDITARAAQTDPVDVELLERVLRRLETL